MHSPDQLMEAVQRHEIILMGDPSREIKGLVERVNTQEAYMGEIRDALKKILWVLVLGVVGAALNMLLSSGKLPLTHPPTQQTTHQAK
jgi:hypothetical protein